MLSNSEGWYAIRGRGGGGCIGVIVIGVGMGKICSMVGSSSGGVGSEKLFNCSVKVIICFDMNVVKSFKGTLVFQAVGDEVKVIIMHKFHSVRMQMRVNVVMDFCIGQLEGGIDDKYVGRLNKTDPVIYRSWTLHGPKDKGFHLLFPTFYEPFIPDLFHKCRETSSVNLNTIKSIPIPHLSVL